MPGVVEVGVSDALAPLAGVAWAVEPMSTISLKSFGDNREFIF